MPMALDNRLQHDCIRCSKMQGSAPCPCRSQDRQGPAALRPPRLGRLGLAAPVGRSPACPCLLRNLAGTELTMNQHRGLRQSGHQAPRCCRQSIYRRSDPSSLHWGCSAPSMRAMWAYWSKSQPGTVTVMKGPNFPEEQPRELELLSLEKAQGDVTHADKALTGGVVGQSQRVPHEGTRADKNKARTLNATLSNGKTLFSLRVIETRAGCPGCCGVSIYGDAKNPPGHSPEQLAGAGTAEQAWTGQDISRAAPSSASQ